LSPEIFDFLWHIGVSIEERQAIDIEFLAFQTELTDVRSLDLVEGVIVRTYVS